ncbi:LysR family transcriptional regulator [Halomonas sp. McH1-25]|uniref:LysR family transcriptional regulator n=1 Tax=unclassified Halomonas TaxID=2609666 RepID=UPI001EF4CAF8|nr:MULTISPECIES: LysR family transcriptional regulator [unclassified Halomonas]MCG7600629.1 LysR family transcriptional regulator [Halomonas sp. McH1-25]MCP1341207.1 LysR family transcriptional regulator [Halomonas sp. FL8]MCP1359948.1 LysR family transcriptional regulator [Halomonas sp. BBD45]MCP1364390.1 LysR family transcriptional regulator [Halomonas sp. BBD48]
MQRWDRIEAFSEVVRLGSFSAAARHLRVSASHVSRLVAQLENQLGSQLLYRTTRRLRLTDAGAVYYDYCRHLFDGFRDAEAAINDLQSSPQGVLKLTSATTFGERYIAPLVNAFQRLHPQLEVRMHFTNRQVDLIDEGFDVAIRMGVLKDSSLIARRLCERREYVVGSKAYFAQVPRPHSLAELAGHRCLVGSRDYWLFEVEGQRREVRVNGRWQANSGPALLDAALKGLGLAQLPDYYVEEHLASGSLISVLDNLQFTGTAVWAVYPRHRHLSPKIRQFIDYLSENFPR